MKKSDTSHATIIVAFCDNKYDKQPEHTVMELPYFWRIFKEPPRVTKNKNGPGITLGHFDKSAWRAAPGKPIPKDKGGKGTGWLQNDFCISSQGYLGDLDNTGDEIWTFNDLCESLDTFKIAYAAYTTHGHTRDSPRLRFVVPFAEPLVGTPTQIAAAYGRVHEYFHEFFHRQLDSRKSPAFMAHLPAVHPDRRGDYEYAVRKNRPLADFSGYVRNNEPEPQCQTGEVEFYPEGSLPDISLSAFRLKDRELDLILHGPRKSEDWWVNHDHSRSAACAVVYFMLEKAGATPAEIAAIVWNPDHGISARWHDDRGKGYYGLCKDIAKMLGARS